MSVNPTKVKLLVLHSWIAGPHPVVEEQAYCDNELDGLGLLLHRTQENLEPISKDAEGIFYDPPGSGKPVVQDALWPRHTTEAVVGHSIISSLYSSMMAWHTFGISRDMVL